MCHQRGELLQRMVMYCVYTVPLALVNDGCAQRMHCSEGMAIDCVTCCRAALLAWQPLRAARVLLCTFVCSFRCLQHSTAMYLSVECDKSNSSSGARG